MANLSTSVETYLPPKIRDLLWLLIHYPQTTISELQTIDPELIKGEPRIPQSALLTIALLIQGSSVSEVISECHDQSLIKTLHYLSVEVHRYPEDSAADAALQIINRMKLRNYQVQLNALQGELSRLSSLGDVHGVLQITKEQQSIRMKVQELYDQVQTSS